MKSRYHHQKIDTLQDIFEILNQDKNVIVYPTTHKNFHDWDSAFDTIYKKKRKVR